MQAFSGIRVIDFTHVLAGPFCTYQLAVMGAEVIKIESPDKPDMMRSEGANRTLGEQGRGSHFMAQGANKKSVLVNFKKEQGREVIYELVRSADVLVENFRCGVLDKHQLGYEAIKKINPQLIYCSMSGFGHTGPKAQHPAYDNVIQAFSGLMAQTGDPVTAPVRVGPPVLDYGTGAQAAFSIASALFQRTRTGEGQYIDVSMLDAALMLMSTSVVDTQITSCAPTPPGNASLSHPGYGCFEARDGLIMIGAYTVAQHVDLWRTIGRIDLADEVQHIDSFALSERRDEYRRVIGDCMKEHTAQHWEDTFNAAGVPAARVRSLDETLRHPQVKSRSVLRSAQAYGDEDANLKAPVAAFQFQHDGPSVSHHAPPGGFHTDEVLHAIGYSSRSIEQLRSDGIVA